MSDFYIVYYELPSLLRDDGPSISILFQQTKLKLSGEFSHDLDPVSYLDITKGNPELASSIPISQPDEPLSLDTSDPLSNQDFHHEDTTIEKAVTEGAAVEETAMDLDDPAPGSAATPGTKPKRRHRTHAKKQKEQKKKADAEQPSGHGYNATYQQRRRTIRALLNKSQLIRSSCTFDLPPFPLTEKQALKMKLVEAMEAWWDWLDDCHQVLDLKSHAVATSYDWSILEVVFGILAKLRGIYGQDYIECQAKLAARKPWVSMHVPDQAQVESVVPRLTEGKLNFCIQTQAQLTFCI